MIIVILIAIAYAVYAEMRIKSNKADGARIMKEVKAEAEHRLAEQRAEGLRRIEELK